MSSKSFQQVLDTAMKNRDGHTGSVPIEEDDLNMLVEAWIHQQELALEAQELAEEAKAFQQEAYYNFIYRNPEVQAHLGKAWTGVKVAWNKVRGQAKVVKATASLDNRLWPAFYKALGDEPTLEIAESWLHSRLHEDNLPSQYMLDNIDMTHMYLSPKEILSQ